MKFEFDFDSQKRELWAFGLLTLVSILLVLTIFRLFLAVGIVSGVYIASFVAVMLKLEMKSKDELNEAYKKAAGVMFLESHTVMSETIVEESLFFVADVISYNELSEGDHAVLHSYKEELAAVVKEKVTNKGKKEGKTDVEIKSIINDVTTWKILKMALIGPDTIEPYDKQYFNYFYLLAPGDDWTAFHLVPNSSVPFCNKFIRATKAFGDLLFLSWVQADAPLFMIYSSPKLALPLTNVRKTLVGVEDKEKQILAHEVLDLREKYSNIDATIEAKEKQIRVFSRQKDLANARSEFIETEAMENPDRTIDPTYIYANKTGFYLSIFLNFLFGALLFAIYLTLNEGGV